MQAEMKIDFSQVLQERLEEIVCDSFENLLKAKEEEVINEFEWMTQTEASQWSKLSPTTLQKWRKQGLKVATIDGKILVSKKELNRFISSFEY